MTDVRLKILTRQKHWTYRTFCAEFNHAAQSLPDGSQVAAPSHAQFHRWTSGAVKGLPYPDACRVLEKMFPGWPVEALFETVNETAPTKPEPSTSTHVTDLLQTADFSQVPEDRITVLAKSLRFSDRDVHELLALQGNIVELAVNIDVMINPSGTASVTYSRHILNLTTMPLDRLVREVWFKHSQGSLEIVPHDYSHRIIEIKQLHTAPNLTKFSCTLTPGLEPGEAGIISYTCHGARFVDEYYWRQAVHRHTRNLTLNVHLRGTARTPRYEAIIERPDGSEGQIGDSVATARVRDGIVMVMTQDTLTPGHTLTLRWTSA